MDTRRKKIMNKLILTMGISCSGKSTLINKFIALDQAYASMQKVEEVK